MRKKVFISFLHGVLVTIFIWLYLNSNFVSEGEIFTGKLLVYLKYFIFKTEGTPLKKYSLLFINTAYDRQLTEIYNEEDQQIGNTDITDREKMITFFRAINTNSKKPAFILFDVQLEHPLKPDTLHIDSVLQVELAKVSNIIIPYSLDEKDHVVKPLFNIAKGLDYYETNAERMVKQSLFPYADLPSIPVVMDSMINGSKYTHHAFFNICNRKLAINNLIPGRYVTWEQVHQKREWREISLFTASVAAGSEELYDKNIAGRFIIVGDFDRDRHLTLNGRVPGALNLYNSYIDLVKERHIVHPAWILLLIFTFSVLSFYTFYAKLPEKYTRRKNAFYAAVNLFLLKFISYGGIAFVLSLISFLVFNIPVNIIIVAVYFSILRDVVKWTRHAKHH